MTKTKTRARARIGRAALVLVAMFALPGYECGDIIDDPGFDLWCGDKLCNWELEAGQVERVPTWHEADTGVSLVGNEVILSQLAEVQGLTGYCVRFQFIADIESSTRVVVEMDANDDGTAEFSERIPTSSWALLEYLVEIPVDFDGLRFRIHKQTAGRAVLAEIEAIESDECDGGSAGQ